MDKPSRRKAKTPSDVSLSDLTFDDDSESQELFFSNGGTEDSELLVRFAELTSQSKPPDTYATLLMEIATALQKVIEDKPLTEADIARIELSKNPTLQDAVRTMRACSYDITRRQCELERVQEAKGKLVAFKERINLLLRRLDQSRVEEARKLLREYISE